MSGVEYSESELLDLAARRDHAAMKAIYDRYVEYLAAACARYVGDENDRKDVLQEAFIKIFTSLDKFEFRGEGSFKAWMVRIAVNEALRFLKRNMSNSFIEYDDKLPDVADEPEPEVDGIPDDVINELILSLPPGYRMVFNLYVFERKSHKEIAKLLGIGESSSASQFSRAKALLSKRIKEYKEKTAGNRRSTGADDSLGALLSAPR